VANSASLPALAQVGGKQTPVVKSSAAGKTSVESLLPKRDVDKVLTNVSSTAAKPVAAKPVAAKPVAKTTAKKIQARQNIVKAQAKTAARKAEAQSQRPSAQMPPVAPQRIARPGEQILRESTPPPVTGDRIPRPGEERANPAGSRFSTAQQQQQPLGDRIARPGENAMKMSGEPAKPPSQAPAVAPAPNRNSTGSTTATTGGASATPSKAQPADMYPAIGNLEKLTFGSSKPDRGIEDRLVELEQAVFATTYSHDSLFDRTERLKNTLLGKTAPPEPSVSPPSGLAEPPSGWVENPMAGNQPDPAELSYLDEVIEKPENHHKASKVVLDGFALELINFERQRRALGQLEPNHVVQKMAEEHTADLVERGIVSHNNPKGENPDRRYTLMGGVDAVSENLALIKSSELGSSNLSKAAVAKVLKQMFMQQDDREALLAPEATHLGFSMQRMDEGQRIIACIEVLSNRGVIHPVPKLAHLGDKIEVSGVLHPPYKFERITLAWEGVSDLPPQEEGGDEPLPYFPPLDFIAYKEKSDKNHDKAIFALKTVGMLAAIAGGMFVPPVALAAPLIMMSGPDPGEPKPVSDVPIKGGVKVSGNTFNGKVTLSNDSKEGLYYLTVWANMGADDKPVAVSRRTILVKQVHDEEDVEGTVSIPKEGDKAKTDSAPTDSKPVDSKPVETTSADKKNDRSSVAPEAQRLPAVTSQESKPQELKPRDSKPKEPSLEIGSSEDPFAPEKSKDALKEVGAEAEAGTLELPTSATHRRSLLDEKSDKEESSEKDETSNSGKQTADDGKLKPESVEGKNDKVD